MNNFENRIKKDYGEHLFLEDQEVKAISTGAVSLDVSLGVGGIPRGRISVLYGAESSGKTTLALEICKSTIKENDKVLYIDAEQGLTREYIGDIFGDVPQEDLKVLQSDTAEHALEIAELAIKGNPNFGVEPGEFGLIVIDSLGALSPVKEQIDDLADANVALMARLLPVFLRRNAYDLRKSKTALLFISQVRDKIGGYMQGYSYIGGHALKHYASVVIFLSRFGQIKQGSDVVGINLKFTVNKNKVGKPFRSWNKLPLLFNEGIDYHKDLLDFSDLLGHTHKKGAVYYITNEEEKLGRGYKEAKKTLLENPEKLDKLVELCYNINKKDTEVVNETDDNNGTDIPDSAL